MEKVKTLLICPKDKKKNLPKTITEIEKSTQNMFLFTFYMRVKHVNDQDAIIKKKFLQKRNDPLCYAYVVM